MTISRALLAAILLFPLALCASDPQADIKTALSTQVEAWNRGDIFTFVSVYAEDCTFVGKQVIQGRDKVMARYKTNYPTKDAMGKLTFGNLNVRLLDKEIAIAIGEWHLDRGQAGGGPIGGIFSLVFELRKGQWLIALDHTS